MKKVHIKQKLADVGIDVSDLILGDYDAIARITAEKQRSREDPLYKSVGCFFTPNRERGILICSLMKQYGLSSFLEIGFGRGYTTLCVAKYMSDLGLDGKIVTVDSNFDEEHMKVLMKLFPREWFSKIRFMHGKSEDVLTELKKAGEAFDLTYIDGDHFYEAVKKDWELSKELTSAITVFDDYHMPSKVDPGIQCARAIDEINFESEGYLEPELVILDRRLFVDDRKFTDEQIDYGQVVFTKKSAKLINELW